MGIRQRLMSLTKVRQGSHLPHPQLTSRQATDEDFHFQKALPVFIDGKKIGKATDLRISVIADAINIYIPSDQV